MQPTTFAASADGTRLAVYDPGTDGPVLVAVHGYPDNASVWDGVVRALAGRVRVVTYDVRGAGASDKPNRRSDYRIARLIEDLHAVIDTVAPADAVHLAGHDWGSVQCWPALTDARLRGRVASFTSISGPSLDHVAAWTRRSVLRQPVLVAAQALRSSYVAVFQLPGLPEALARRRVLERGAQRAQAQPASAPVRSEADAVNGLYLYRANVFGAFARPRPQRIDVPVQVVVLRDDRFLDPRLCAQAPQPWVSELSVVELPGSHWMVAEQPEEIARCLAEFVER